MKISIIKTFDEFIHLKDKWNSLVASSFTPSPFSQHEFLTTWWESLGGGEWQTGELFIVAGYEENKLTASAPLFLHTLPDNTTQIHFIGSFEIADYLDFICPLAKLEELISSTLKELTELSKTKSISIVLNNIIDDSPSIPILQSLAPQYQMTIETDQLQPAPYITLPESWDAYLSNIKKKQRHEIRRKLRRAENLDSSVNWHSVTEKETLDADIDAFFSLMRFDEKKSQFLTEQMEKHLRAFIHNAFDEGWLQLYFLEIGGEKASAYLSFDYKDTLYVYNSGIDYSFSQLSPGWVLLSYIIQQAIKNGKKRIDFMRGDETYKYRFGGINKFVYRITLNPEN